MSLDHTNVSLLLDTSGSMDGKKLADLKTSASTFVYIMKRKDGLALIDFNRNANYLYPPTNTGMKLIPVDDPKVVQDAAVEKIESLQDQGTTNIKEAIEYGENQLKHRNSNNHPKNMVLLSDGQYNTGGNPVPDLPEEIKIHTISLGNNSVNQIIMKEIAMKTGGVYHHSTTPADLVEIYNACLGDTNVSLVLVNQRIILEKYQPRIIPAEYASGSKMLECSVYWENENVRYTPDIPSGNQINVSFNGPDGEIEQVVPYAKGDRFVIFKIPVSNAGQYNATVWYTGDSKLLTTLAFFDPNQSVIQLHAEATSDSKSGMGNIEILANVTEEDKKIPATINVSLEYPLISVEEALKGNHSKSDKYKPDVSYQGSNGEVQLLEPKLGNKRDHLEIPVSYRPVFLKNLKNNTKKGEVKTQISGAYILRITAHGVSPKTKEPFTLTRRVSINVE